MKSLKLFLVLVTAVLYTTSSNAQTLVIDWNEEIYPLSQTLHVDYDFGSNNYSRRVYIDDLYDQQGWIRIDSLTELMSGEGSEYITVAGLNNDNGSYLIQLRLKVPGEVEELEYPRPTTGNGMYSFTPLPLPTLVVSDQPTGELPNYTFTVTAGYGHAADADSVKLEIIITNETTDSEWHLWRELVPGHSNTEVFTLDLEEAGHYRICYKIWYKDAGLSPLWDWTEITNSCDNGDELEFDYDFSTSVEDVEAPKCSSPRVWPNPTSGAISLEGFVSERTIELSDASGRLISTYSGIEQQLDLSALSAGVYILSQGDKGCVRVVKE